MSKIARNIELDQHGLWVANTVANVSYPDAGNEFCFAIEESSFWFQHRNHCILEVVRSFPPAGAFFDVGGGNGFVARALQNAGVETVLIEPGLTGARNALGRGIRNVIRATLEDAGFLPEVLPAVGLFDVIEHIKEDLEFLAGLHGLLIPNGRIYVTAPALNSLWSQEDNDAGHWRRYTVHSMCKVLEEAGFLGEFATYFFGFLPLPILLLRALPYRLGFVPKEPGHDARDHELNSSLAKRVLRTLTRRELSKIAAARQCICGASCLAVARKC